MQSLDNLPNSRSDSNDPGKWRQAEYSDEVMSGVDEVNPKRYVEDEYDDEDVLYYDSGQQGPPD